MAEGLPARLDRAALERVLQRAAELQASERDIGEGITPDEVMALGREVGIPGRFLQQAILEEGARVVPAASGLLDRMVGPAAVSARRVIQGDLERTQAALVAYMEEHELLCLQRAQPGRVTWEPLGGFQAAIRRSTAAFGGKRPFMLDRAASVSAVFTALEQGYVHVSLAADLRMARSAMLGGGAALTSIGLAGGAALIVMGIFPVFAVAPVVAGAGLGALTARQHRPRAERVLIGLERALDHLEQGSAAPRALPGREPGLGTLLGNEIRAGIRKALK